MFIGQETGWAMDRMPDLHFINVKIISLTISGISARPQTGKHSPYSVLHYLIKFHLKKIKLCSVSVLLALHIQVTVLKTNSFMPLPSLLCALGSPVVSGSFNFSKDLNHLKAFLLRLIPH